MVASLFGFVVVSGIDRSVLTASPIRSVVNTWFLPGFSAERLAADRREKPTGTTTPLSPSTKALNRPSATVGQGDMTSYQSATLELHSIYP